MQDLQGMRELSDRDLESVVGGSGQHHYQFQPLHHSGSTSAGIGVSASGGGGQTSANVGVTASASGGHLDIVILETTSVSESFGNGGPSVSFAGGFGVAISV
jgi:hypothetical protein